MAGCYAPGLKTKNKKAVRQRLIGPPGDSVERQRAYVDEVQRRTGRICQAMFVYPDGRPIKDPIDAFKAAKKQAGFPDLRMHDFCRSVWQNEVNAGVPEKDLMDATGRKTRSIADRYNISDESQLEAVQQRMASAYGRAQPDRKVSSMGEGRWK